MNAPNQAVFALMMQLNISHEQACSLMSGVPHDVVGQMRTIDAPNRGNFWAQNSTLSRADLFAEQSLHYCTEQEMQQRVDPPKPVVPARKYTPRSTNASMDAMKKMREQLSSKDATIGVLTKALKTA